VRQNFLLKYDKAHKGKCVFFRTLKEVTKFFKTFFCLLLLFINQNVEILLKEFGEGKTFFLKPKVYIKGCLI
jgi:hypothetical protein